KKSKTSNDRSFLICRLVEPRRRTLQTFRLKKIYLLLRGGCSQPIEPTKAQLGEIHRPWPGKAPQSEEPLPTRRAQNRPWLALKSREKLNPPLASLPLCPTNPCVISSTTTSCTRRRPRFSPALTSELRQVPRRAAGISYPP